MDVFIKRVLVEKHISGIVFENPRREPQVTVHSCLSLPTPMSHKIEII